MLETRSVAEVRAAEEPLLAAGVPLMERAATALAQHVRQLLADAGAGRRAAVSLLIGAGNNGGDALYAGAQLARRGYEVTAYLAGSQVHSAGLIALLSAGGRAVKIAGALTHYEDAAGLPELPVPEAAAAIARSAAIVDGLLGIGASGGMSGVAGDLVATLNSRLPSVAERQKYPPSPPAFLPRTAGRTTTDGVPESSADAETEIFRTRPIVVAVDTPSGIDVDEGGLPGPVLPADNTVTFGAIKPGLVLPPASHSAGSTHLVDIGLDFEGNPPEPHDGPVAPRVRRLEPQDVARAWPIPGPTDHKYTRGVVGVVAGTGLFPGAAILTCTAVVRAGAGMVRYQGPMDVARMVVQARPEVVPAGGQVQAWVLGPGLPPTSNLTSGGGAGQGGLGGGADGQRSERAAMHRTLELPPNPLHTPVSSDDAEAQAERARAALAAAAGLLPGAGAPVPAVVDAGALSLIDRPLPPWIVLTPHAGELATLFGARGVNVERAQIEAEPLRWATEAHRLTGATVLLKGATTVVVGPGEHGGVQVYSQADAPGWLATAGSGDVLAGLLGSMLAARSAEVVARPWLAAEIAAAAALVHGRAAAEVSQAGVGGRAGTTGAGPGGPVAALDVAQELPATIARLLAEV